MATNAGWHAKNPMPPGAKLDERIRWHLTHAKACGCRPIPARVAEAIQEQTGRSAAGAAQGSQAVDSPRGEPFPHPGRGASGRGR